MKFHNDVVVIGGGAAGLCTALALGSVGKGVTLIERDPSLFNRASQRNEGKIHLGLIYAAETGRSTADLQLRGALCFDRLLAEWTKDASRLMHVSTAFDYLVHGDSILSPAQLEEHYAHVETRYHEAISEDTAARYLGERPDQLWGPLHQSKLAHWFSADRFIAGYRTAERAIDPAQMGAALIQAIPHYPSLSIRCSHRVRTVRRSSSGFILEGDGPDGSWRAEAAQVVNATWDDLYRLDMEAGLPPPPGWLMRLKYRVLARLPDRLRDAPSATLVLGPFGDVVIRPDGTAYLSWYPTGLRGWSHDVQTPADWEAPATGREDPARAREIAAEVLSRIDDWMPGIGQAVPYQVDAGAILAHGKTDVDDPQSGLHGRMDSGVTSLDGWHSLNPGKLTTAPLFAAEAAAAVLNGGSL